MGNDSIKNIFINTYPIKSTTGFFNPCINSVTGVFVRYIKIIPSVKGNIFALINMPNNPPSFFVPFAVHHEMAEWFWMINCNELGWNQVQTALICCSNIYIQDLYKAD